MAAGRKAAGRAAGARASAIIPISAPEVIIDVGVCRLKRILLLLSGLILLGACLTACNNNYYPYGYNPYGYGYGYGGTPTTTTSGNASGPSGLSKRALISNSVAGNLNVLDANLDLFSNSLISVPGTPGQMSVSPDLSVTLVFNASGNSIAVVTNSTETSGGSIILPDVSTSFVALNNIYGFASVRNAQLLEVLDLSNLKIATSMSMPTPNQIVLAHNGKTLLVFSDTLPGSIIVVDTATATSNPVAAATVVSAAGFDHPISGVFSSDDSKAYILSCGVECGGAAASVTVLDMTTSPPTPGASVAVAGATVGFLNSPNLYVAGNSTSGTGTGVLTTVDTGSMTASAPVAIGDGFHRKMALDNHGHLFIGARTCSQQRCLTIFNTASQAVNVESDPTNGGNGFGDVGGIQPISGRDRIYLAQGGELRIFETTTPSPLPQAQQLDAVGFIQDVVQIDP